MGLSDLSKQLDDRKSSNKEQPYSMGRQTVRKARPDLTDKDFQASIKLKTMPAVIWLEVEFPKVFVDEINDYIDTTVMEKNEDYSNRLVGQLKTEKSAQLDFPLKGTETGEQFKKVLENLGMSFIQKPYGRMSSVECFEAWTVHSYAGDYNPLHDHGVHTGSGLSCIFYLKVPDETRGSGVLQFLSGQSKHMSDFTHCSRRDADNFVVDPVEGDLFLFPSAMLHYVEPNEVDFDRISIAFNHEFQYKDEGRLNSCPNVRPSFDDAMVFGVNPDDGNLIYPK